MGEELFRTMHIEAMAMTFAPIFSLRPPNLSLGIKISQGLIKVAAKGRISAQKAYNSNVRIR